MARLRLRLRDYVALPELDQAGLDRAGREAVRVLQARDSEWPSRGGGVRGQATGRSKRMFSWRVDGQDVWIDNRARYSSYPEAGTPNPASRGRAARTLRRNAKRIADAAGDSRTVERRARDVDILRSRGPDSQLSRQARLREARRRRAAWRRTAARRLDRIHEGRIVTPPRSRGQRLLTLSIAAAMATGEPAALAGALRGGRVSPRSIIVALQIASVI